MDEARRFLEMIRREMKASDVRIELGLMPPANVFASVEIGSGAYLVVHFDGTSTSDVGAAREKLGELLSAFREAAEEASRALALGAIPLAPAGATRSSHPPSSHTSTAELALTEALQALAALAKAELALVIDDKSPEIWGSSDPELLYHSTDDAMASARLEARLVQSDGALLPLLGLPAIERRTRIAELTTELAANEVSSLLRQLERVEHVTEDIEPARWRRVAHAIAEARGLLPDDLRGQDMHVHLKPFAGIYRAILVYESPFSELHAEGALLRALPIIEKLVTSLPPRDPASGGAKVAVLRRLRRV